MGRTTGNWSQTGKDYSERRWEAQTEKDSPETQREAQTEKDYPERPWGAQTQKDSPETRRGGWGAQTQKDSPETQRDAQTGIALPDQASPGRQKGLQPRAATANLPESFLPERWMLCRPALRGCLPCRSRTPAARPRRRSR